MIAIPMKKGEIDLNKRFIVLSLEGDCFSLVVIDM
jgi:hypothetical protein